MMKKKKIIIISILIFITISLLFILNNKKTFKIDNVTYAVTLDGTTVTSIPSKGAYAVSVTCNNASGKWLYDEWKLLVTDITGDVSCNVDFTSVTVANNYLNNKVISLAGRTTGTGQVVHETFSTTTFTPTTTFDSSYYPNTSNDATYPFTWDGTAKTWTSTNKTDSATATFTFKPSTAGTVGFCYTVSSEDGCDKVTIYVDDVSKGEDSGEKTSCLTLNDLTTSNVVKVTYSKDDSDASGNDNVIFHFATGTASTDNYDTGYRYEGFNPNNYVWFNNELWRVIGVFDTTLADGATTQSLTKIIRASSIGGLAWDKANINDWSTASLKNLLNGAYLNKQDGTSSGYCYGYSTNMTTNCDYTDIGINDNYRNMIKNITWKLGGWSDSNVTTEAMYGYERGTTVYSGRPTSTTGYIGLMYPSDYGYSVLASSCARTTNLYLYDSATCGGQSWLYGQGLELTQSPNSSNSIFVFSLNDNGYLDNSLAFIGYAFRPTLYLDSTVYVITGTGTKLDPYILAM
jgi:hypothetical protein